MSSISCSRAVAMRTILATRARGTPILEERIARSKGWWGDADQQARFTLRRWPRRRAHGRGAQHGFGHPRLSRGGHATAHAHADRPIHGRLALPAALLGRVANR